MSSVFRYVLFVREEFIALAVLRLVEEEKATIEGAGATGLASCLAGLVPELKGKRLEIRIQNFKKYKAKRNLNKSDILKNPRYRL